MRRRFLAVPMLAAMLLCCLAVGCTPTKTQTVRSNEIEGFRTDPDHKGLVASYVGGACDTRARLVLTESETRIDAKVIVEQSVAGCPAIGVPRTVASRLTDPVGERVIRSGGREYVPFDGAHLLTSSAWPAGFDGMSEMADPRPAASYSPNARVITRGWVTTRFATDRSSNPADCPVSRGILELRIGPDPYRTHTGRVDVGTTEVGAATAHVYRHGTDPEPEAWTVVWRVDGRRVELSNDVACSNRDRLLDRAGLLRVAESLRPA